MVYWYCDMGICLTWCSCLIIQRSPADTRDQDQKVWYTDVEKWRKFSRTYAKDTQQISLLVSSGTLHISRAGC